MQEQKIRILFGAECFDGGVLRHLNYLLSNIDISRYDVFLIVSTFGLHNHGERILNELSDKGIRIERWPIYHSIKPFHDYKTIKRLSDFMDTERIQVVHAHSSKAGLLFRIAARMRDIPAAYTPHCFYFNARHDIIGKIAWTAEWFLSRISACIIISSPETEQAKSLLNRKNNTPIIIDNCIDPVEFPRFKNQPEQHYKWEIPDNTVVIGWIGRFCTQKNWQLFLAAARIVSDQQKNTRFIMVGEGSQKDKASRHISKHLPKNTKIIGYEENPAIFYSNIDIFVSTSKWEGLPYTYLEALHYNLPMVIPLTPGIKQGIRGANVRYYPVNNLRELSSEITEALKQKTIFPSASCSPTNRNSFRNFICEHERLYNTLANSVTPDK